MSSKIQNNDHMQFFKRNSRVQTKTETRIASTLEESPEELVSFPLLSITCTYKIKLHEIQ